MPEIQSTIIIDTSAQQLAGSETDNTVISHTHSNGHIETVIGKEQAIKVCPVLGKIAMTDPELANSMLNLSTIEIPGMDIDALLAKKFERDDKIDKKVEVVQQQKETEPKNQKDNKTIIEAELDVAEISTPTIPTVMMEKIENTQSELIHLEHTTKQISQDQEQIPNEEKELSITNNIHDSSENTELKNHIEEVLSPVLDTDQIEQLVPLKSPTVVNTEIFTKSETTDEPVIEITKPEATEPHAPYTDSQEQVGLAEEEVVEEFDTLNDQNFNTNQTDINQQPYNPEESLNLLSSSETINNTSNDEDVSFELFLSEQPIDDSIDSVNEIKQKANVQPAEVTFVQLAKIIEANLPVHDEIIDSINNLSRMFTEISDDSKEAKILITPEITKELLNFLSLLGYSNPSETLVNLILERDVEFIAESIKHLSGTIIIEEKHEFLNQTTYVNFINDIGMELTAILGRVTLSFC